MELLKGQDGYGGILLSELTKEDRRKRREERYSAEQHTYEMRTHGQYFARNKYTTPTRCHDSQAMIPYVYLNPKRVAVPI